jgi:hypothetical protein
VEHTVTRTVSVELSSFSRESVAEQAARQRIPVAVLLRHAVLYYLAERGSDRLAPQLPRFARTTPLGDDSVHVEVDLEDAEWEAFERAAASAGVPLSRLLGHAALLYVAEVDSGIVARRLVDDDD